MILEIPGATNYDKLDWKNQISVCSLQMQNADDFMTNNKHKNVEPMDFCHIYI